MQLTRHTDYALRLLIYLDVHGPEPITARAVAESYGISQHHLMKIITRLVDLGHIRSLRGRGGGLQLATPADQINVGAVVRQLEANMDIAECFSADRNTCPLAPACCLKRVLHEATDAFLTVLDGYQLSELTRNKTALRRLLAT